MSMNWFLSICSTSLEYTTVHFDSFVSKARRKMLPICLVICEIHFQLIRNVQTNSQPFLILPPDGPRPAAKSRKIPALLDQFACSTRCPLQIVQSQCVHLQDAVCYLKEPDPKMPSSLYLVEIHSHSNAISYLSASSYFLLTSRKFSTHPVALIMCKKNNIESHMSSVY